MIRMLFLMLLALACPASAAVLTAAPGSLPGVLAAAKPGDTIVLTAGNHGAPTIRGKFAAPGVVIDLGTNDAQMSVTFRGAAGITLQGGRLGYTPVGPGVGAAGYAVNIASSTRIAVRSATITRAVRGIVVNGSSDIDITDNVLVDLRSDGIDFGMSSGARVERNVCIRFTPAPADHPDCVQLIQARVGDKPNSDIVIRSNYASGAMQGFNGFAHGRGGYDRIVVEDNHYAGEYVWAVSISDCRDCRVTGNSARGTNPRYQVQIVTTGERSIVEGNRVEMRP